MTSDTITFPPEWANQSGVQIIWPQSGTDWAPYLEEARRCFASIAREISKRELLLVITDDSAATRKQLALCNQENLRLIELPCNDTWSRDVSGITIYENGQLKLLDFGFNGWGLKFPACHDNLLTRGLFKAGVFAPAVHYQNALDFILEGGAIDTDGAGTILSTACCLFSPNRNGGFSQEIIIDKLKNFFKTDRIFLLENGHLEGDDTDGHIDTLARFCSRDTIVYVHCSDDQDSHYHSLQNMERELAALRMPDGTPYHLVPLPMPDPVYSEGRRLPATYANFLIINGAVLVPQYGSSKDSIAKETFKTLFPDREIIGIDCSVLIKQHGSLHCVTMQYPAGVLI